MADQGPIRFIMIGGFLGAGKTTLISRLAHHYQSQGLHVCIVTNDQAAGLVDTLLLQSQGFEVSEVAGSCFCCNFNGLTSAMDEFAQRQRPDIILAEPVGSCTDLIATIAIPMQERLNEMFSHSPYAVVLKPSHGMKILSGDGRGGFSPKAEYIFRKQLEESEVIILNRIDELPAEYVQRLRTYLEEQYPGREVIGLSAKTGENLQQLIDAFERQAPERSLTMDVDYDTYAEGEAELGWLNATCSVTPVASSVALDELVVDVVDALREQLAARSAEPAHLKVLCMADSATSVANLVSSDTPSMLSVSSESVATNARLIINARVRLNPETLEQVVRDVLQWLAKRDSLEIGIEQLQSFRPGRPVPTHRVEREPT